MIRALLLAFSQLSDPASRRVLLVSVVGAVLSFAALLGLVGWLLTHTAVTDLAWVDTVVDVLGGVATLALSWLLFPAVVATLASFLLEDVVRAVERRHYPHLPEPASPSLAAELATALRFLAVVVAVNLAALPLYLVPGFNLLIYYTVNGYLLGREYFELVANRRLGRRSAAELRKSSPLKPFLAGVVIAFLSTLPLVNLLVPVVASAFMVHVFQSMKAPLRPAGRP